jgi:hypothetical protein
MMGLAMPASRSLIALLIGTVVFFALWMFALKPSSSTTGGSGGGKSSQGLGALQSDINKAHHAVATSNASNAASGNENATQGSGRASASHPSAASSPSSAASSHSAAKPAATSHAKPAAKSSASMTAAQRRAAANAVNAVQRAVRAHKALALLFYNPAAADDRAVRQELAKVSAHKGHVLKLAIPLNEAANFGAVTQHVPINLSPTLVLVSRAGDATEIVGYSDPFEINQRVDQALAS